MTETQTKEDIQRCLAGFSRGDLAANARSLLAALGYRSEKRIDLAPNIADEFRANFDADGRMNPAAALLDRWESVDVLFQLTNEEVRAAAGGQLAFAALGEPVDGAIIESYLFIAIGLAGSHYTRSQLAGATREVNKLFPMPVLILFRHGDTLTLAVIDRRLNKKDASRDVLDKVTLIKDIAYARPHRAHLEILFDLSFDELRARHGFTNFVELHRAWGKALDTAELNKKFFREVANWYYWAVDNVTFPPGAGADPATRNAVSVIRLITRLIFVWFIKEKGLVPPELFEKRALDRLLRWNDPRGSTYYKAILQNLFFATLNTDMERDKPGSRRFRGKNDSGRDAHYGIANVYRYQECFTDPDAALALFADVPFLNGGLFECLDRAAEGVRIDGFSDRADNPLVVPDFLFFGEERNVDLNETLGTRNKQYRVQGLLRIFERYKFTIEENTPIEEEIALDPELLGKVFENLLAEYNPETGATARKQTGSFYTPRPIVEYMVDESLLAYLQTRLAPEGGEDDAALRDRLAGLLAYTDRPHDFDAAETSRLIAAIDQVKVLDPACGSGAFPMGVLHKLVYLLGRLDPGNARWRARQIEKAAEIPDATAAEAAIASIEQVFGLNYNNYGRKLYLIENCIYGVDIQPIAVQIAKLRFFISLVVDQKVDDARPNRGIRALPNLETKFVAANTLIGIPKSSTATPDPPETPSADLLSIYDDLLDTFRQYLKVGLPANKEKWLQQGRELCTEINRHLQHQSDFQALDADWLFPTSRSIDDLRSHLPGATASSQAMTLPMRNPAIEQKEAELAAVRRRHFSARSPATKEKCRAQDRRLREELARLLQADGWRAETAGQLAAWDPYDQSAHADFFDPEWMFGVVKGFDIAIGNPPYVRADSGAAHLAARRAIEASGQYETLWEKWDLYVAFIERGYKLLKPRGVTSLIVSDAYCHSKYAQKSQAWFLQNSRILRLDFLSKLQIFDAGVRNLTYLIQHADGQSNRPQRRVHGPEFGMVTLLPTDEQRNLTYRAFFPEDGVEQRFSRPTIAIKDICYVSFGCRPNSDERIARGEFVVADLLCERMDTNHPKPYIEAKDVVRWSYAQTRWLEWGTARSPALWARPTFEALYEVPEKIVAADVSGAQNRAAYDSSHIFHSHTLISFVPWHSLFGVRNKSLKKAARYRDEDPRPDLPRREDLEQTSHRFAVKYLLAVMNSSAARDFLRANRRSNIHLYPDDWKKLPIPDVASEDQVRVATIVDKILAALRVDPNADVSALEAEVDRLVCQLYGLTPEETREDPLQQEAKP